MKKLLGFALTCTLSVTTAFAIVGCGGNNGKSDAEIAKEAIDKVAILYAGKDVDTPSDYPVIGQVKVDDDTYNVNWSVSSSAANYSDYVSVGAMDETTKQVTVSITTGEEVIEYKLTASVTVGEVTETTDFNRRIPVLGTIYTPSQAKTLGESLASDAYYQENGADAQITVRGYVVDVGTWSSQYNNWTNVYIADTFSDDMTKDSEGTLQVYRLAKDDTYLTGADALEKGDLVTLQGYLQNYRGNTVELTYKGTTNPTCIGVQKAQRTDAEKVAAAKAEIDLASKLYNAITEVALTTSKSGATLSWAVKDSSEYVTVENNTLKIVKLPEANTEVTLVVTITAGSASDTKEITITVAPAPTEEKIYNASEAQALGLALASGAYYQENGTITTIKVQGYVVDAGTYSTDYNNYNKIYLSDTENGDKTFYVYRAVKDDVYLTEANSLEVGDFATFEGYVQNYNGTVEMTYCNETNKTGDGNVRCVSLVKPDLTDAEKVAKALAKVNDTLTVSVAGDFTLPASTVQGVTFAWSTADETYTVTENKLAVNELPETEATVTLTLTATCGEETDTKTVTVTIAAAVDDTNYGTAEAPVSVTEALAIAAKQCANSNDVTKQVVYVEGVVKSVGSIGSYYSNIYITDENDSTKEILVYSMNKTTGVADPAQNDTIVLYGYIKNYNSTIEFASANSQYPVIVSNVRGTSTITSTVGEGATIAGLPATKTNGEAVSFTVTVETGKKVTLVQAGGVDLTADDNGNYTFTVNGNMTVTVETADEGAVVPEKATITFDDTTKRTSFSTTEQVWVENGITVTNNKASSTTNIADYSNPIRIYKSSTVSVACNGMTKIVFHANSASYTDALKTSVESAQLTGATVTVEGKDVTVVFESSVNSIEFTASAQIRLDSIDVMSVN